jgi:hypothetical protein
MPTNAEAQSTTVTPMAAQTSPPSVRGLARPALDPVMKVVVMHRSSRGSSVKHQFRSLSNSSVRLYR